jgi:hypothetical protein
LSLASLVVLQWCATAWQPLTGLLKTVPLSATDWLVVAVSVAWPVAGLEAVKMARAPGPLTRSVAAADRLLRDAVERLGDQRNVQRDLAALDVDQHRGAGP